MHSFPHLSSRRELTPSVLPVLKCRTSYLLPLLFLPLLLCWHFPGISLLRLAFEQRLSHANRSWISLLPRAQMQTLKRTLIHKLRHTQIQTRTHTNVGSHTLPRTHCLTHTYEHTSLTHTHTYFLALPRTHTHTHTHTLPHTPKRVLTRTFSYTP
jgi:hypothetical protein